MIRLRLKMDPSSTVPFNVAAKLLTSPFLTLVLNYTKNPEEKRRLSRHHISYFFNFITKPTYLDNRELSRTEATVPAGRSL